METSAKTRDVADPPRYGLFFLNYKFVLVHVAKLKKTGQLRGPILLQSGWPGFLVISIINIFAIGIIRKL